MRERAGSSPVMYNFFVLRSLNPDTPFFLLILSVIGDPFYFMSYLRLFLHTHLCNKTEECPKQNRKKKHNEHTVAAATTTSSWIGAFQKLISTFSKFSKIMWNDVQDRLKESVSKVVNKTLAGTKFDSNKQYVDLCELVNRYVSKISLTLSLRLRSTFANVSQGMSQGIAIKQVIV